MSKKKIKQPKQQPATMEQEIKEPAKEKAQQQEIKTIEPMDAPKASINERLNHAYIAKEYTLLNGGVDNVIMIQAAREGRYPIDVLLTFEGLDEVVGQLRPDTVAKTEDKADGHEE